MLELWVLIVIAPNKDILNDSRNQFIDFKQGLRS